MLTGLLAVRVVAARSETSLDPVNVRDFGAVGDGNTDDTAAIQAAVNACLSISEQSQPVWITREGNKTVAGRTYFSHPALIVPRGVYRITRPIVVLHNLYICGEGEAVIEQSDPFSSIFYVYAIGQSVQARVENLRFKGGKVQLQFWTNNNSYASIQIDNCTFADSTGYAVECRVYTKEELPGEQWESSKPWAPYDVQWKNGKPILTINNADHLKEWFNSTVMTIDASRFDNCIGVVDSNCDTLVIRDSTVVANPQTTAAIFNLPSGETHLYNIKGSASPAAGIHPWWIEGGGILSVRDSNFESPVEAGIEFIRVNQVHRPASVLVGGFCIILENCTVSASGSPHNAIIWLCKGTQPDILSITGVQETSGKPVKAIVWEDSSLLSDLRNFALSVEEAALTDQYKIELDANSSNIDVTLPTALQPFRQKPVLRSAIKAVTVAEQEWNYNDLEKGAPKILYVKNFMGRSISEGDDTAMVQKAFDVAARAGYCQLVFPARTFRVNNTIRISSDVIVRGAGMVVFEQTDPRKDLFVAKNVQRLGFKSCVLASGLRGVNIINTSNQGSRIAFENCWISDQQTAIHCMAGEEKTAQANQTELQIQDCILTAVRGLVTNASRSQIAGGWMVNDPILNEAAFIENRGGAMRVEGALGVPSSWAGERSRPPENVKNWPYSRNIRWIDNWGQLHCLDTRFGGESGGICPIFNRSTEGTVYFEGGVTRYQNGLTKKTLLYMEQDPKIAILRNISSIPYHIKGSGAARVIRPQSRAGYPNLIISGVMEPE